MVLMDYFKQGAIMRRYAIIRNLGEGFGSKTMEELSGAAAASNAVLAQIDGLQWDHSYITDTGTICIYLAESVEKIIEHSEQSGFPADEIIEVFSVIDPTTAN